MTFLRLSLYAALLCLLGACGAGDYGDEDGFNPPEDTAQPVEYEGNTDAAALSTTNAGSFIYRVLMQKRRASRFDLIKDLPDSSVTAVSSSAMKPLGTVGVRVPVSDTYDEASQRSRDCESGRIDYYLMLNDEPNYNQTGKHVTDFLSCLEEGVLTDGLITQQIHAYEKSDDVILHSTMRFNRMIYNMNGVDFIRSGTIEYSSDYFGEVIHQILNVVYTRTDSGAMYWRRNMTYEWGESLVGAEYGESVSGRFYDGFHGYVDVTTPEALQFGTAGGKLALAGANNSMVLLEHLTGAGYRGSVFSLKLDADGDEVYEITAILDLNLLGSEVNADIGDDDGDGMHNSWETYYELDPQNPGDAGLDPDGDSINNLDEYLSGSSPLGLPPHPDVAVELDNQTGGNFVAGTEHALFFRVENIGTSPGYGSVEFTLPPEFGLLSVSPPPPFSSDISCEIAGNIVTCELTSVQVDAAETVRIDVMLPGTAGTYSYEIAISTTQPDYNPSNDVLNGQIEVIPATP